MSKDSIGQLQEEAAAAFSRLLNKILWGRKYPRDYGTGELLHMAEAQLLDHIGSQRNATTTALAQQLGVSKAAISTLVTKLEARGYISKTVSTVHGKIKHLTLTGQGRKARKNFRTHHARLQGYLVGITPAELRGHLNMLLRMERFIDDHHEQLKLTLQLKRSI